MTPVFGPSGGIWQWPTRLVELQAVFPKVPLKPRQTAWTEARSWLERLPKSTH